MKKKSSIGTYQRVTAGTALLSILHGAILPQFSWALSVNPAPAPGHTSGPTVNSGLNANALDTGKLDAIKPNSAQAGGSLENIQCEDFCGKLISASPDQADALKDSTDIAQLAQITRSVTGAASWGPKDDQFCADHGVGTNPAVSAKATPIPPPDATSGKKGCNVIMVSGDKDCTTVNKQILQCKLFGSQVIPACLAYKAVGNAIGFQTLVAAADVAAAASCGSACGNGVVLPIAVAMGACQAVGAAAAVTELVSVFTMSSGPEASIVSGLLAGAGGVGVGGTVYAGGIGAAQTAEEAAEEASLKLTTNDSLSSTGDDIIKARDNAKDAAKETENAQQKFACAAAIFFTGMAVSRIVSAELYKGHQQGEACKNIQSLISNAAAANPDSPSPTNLNTAGFGPGGAVGGGGGGISNAGGLTSNAGDPSGNTNVGNTNAVLPPGFEKATDGGLLSNSKLDKIVAPLIPPVLSALKSGASVGSLLEKAVGGEAGAGLSTLASAAQAHAKEIGATLNGGGPAGSSYSSSGGGGRSGGSGGAGSDPFAALFGGAGAKGGSAAAGGTQSFGRAPANDIWHAGTHMNIFEIVSDKVSKVSSRVAR